MASRLGAKTAYVGKLGDDDHGVAYRRNFLANNIDISHLAVEPATNTGIATIFVESDTGENQIVIVPGANANVTEDFVSSAEPLIAAAAAVVVNLEMNPAGTLAALRLARKHKVMTILNAAPGKADLHQEFLDNTDVLCVNETEAELLCGVTATEEIGWKESVSRLKKRLDGGTVILTL